MSNPSGPAATALERIVFNYRKKSLLTICSLSAFLIFSTAFLRLVYFKFLDLNISTLLTMGLLVLILRVFVDRTRKLAIAARLLNWFFLIAIPLRVFQTGGVSSPVWFLYAFHCAFVFSIMGRKQGVALLIWCCLSLAAFSHLQVLGLVAEPVFYQNVLNHTFVVVSCAAVAILPIFILIREKNAVESELRELERERISRSISLKLARNTTRPLSEALHSVEEMKQGRECYRKLESALEEVDAAVKAMSKEADSGSLANGG